MIRPQLGFEIGPGRKGAFAGPLRIGVHDRIEHLQAVMAHAEGVGVGERQAKRAANLAMVLGGAVPFAAHILGWRADVRQPAKHGFLQVAIEHEWPPD